MMSDNWADKEAGEGGGVIKDGGRGGWYLTAPWVVPLL